MVRSTITFKPGKTPVCGSIYIACSTEQARRHPGRAACPSVVIMDGQSVKTTERGFDAHKRVKGRKRHILVETLAYWLPIRVEPADTSDRRAGALLLGGLSALFPRILTVIADAGHQSRKFARTLKQDQGWQLRIVKRRQRAFKITVIFTLFPSTPGRGIEISPMRKLEGGLGLSRRTAFMKFDPLFVIRFFTRSHAVPAGGMIAKRPGEVGK